MSRGVTAAAIAAVDVLEVGAPCTMKFRRIGVGMSDTVRTDALKLARIEAPV